MFKNSRGQSLIEYLIIVALIGIGSIAIMRSLGQTIYVRFANITNALQNKNDDIKTENVRTELHQKRGLNDFFKAAGDAGSNEH